MNYVFSRDLAVHLFYVASRGFCLRRLRRDWVPCTLSQAELWDTLRTKMAATVAGLPQAQNQVKQQAGGASDRSLRSVFGTS